MKGFGKDISHTIVGVSFLEILLKLSNPVDMIPVNLLAEVISMSQKLYDDIAIC